MKKSFKALFSIFAIFSLIACGGKSSKSEISSSSNKSIESTNSQQSSSVEESSSSYETTSHIDTSVDSDKTSSEEEIYYHVTFVNYDDSVLYEVDVLEGEEAIYDGEIPTRDEDEKCTYSFKGWDIDLTSIVSDVTAKATYLEIAKADEGEWEPIIWP